MRFTFYNYTGEDIRVNKTSLLGTGTTIQGDHYAGDQSVLNPVIYISSATMPSWNYCYCQEYNRYYFVSAPVWMSDSVWQLTLTCDPLMSWRTKISAQSGVIQYSNQGMRTKYDPRLVYNVAPSVTTTQTVSTLKNGGVPKILMRYKFFAGGSNPVDITKVTNNMKYCIMSMRSFDRFQKRLHDLGNMHQAVAVEVGKCIVDFSVVRWINEGDYTSSTTILFNSDGISAAMVAEEMVDPLNGYTFDLGNGYDVYNLLNEDPQTGYDISWFIEPDTYWKKKAAREIYIPFVGEVSLDLDLLGQGFNPALFVGVNIRYDFAGNAYIVTPKTGALTSDPDDLPTWYPYAAVRFPNQYSVGYTYESAMTLADIQRESQALSLVSTAVGSLTGAFATGGLSLPQGMVSLAMGIGNMNIQNEKMEYQRASTFTMQGSGNGGSSDCVFVETPIAASPRVYPNVLLITRTNEPAAGYEDFWNRFGLPDGVYRSLSGMTGYVQLADVILTGFNGVSLTEREDIRRALLGGVIM